MSDKTIEEMCDWNGCKLAKHLGPHQYSFLPTPEPQEAAPQAQAKYCPHAQRCVHPCDSDECFLETIEKPSGPDMKWTKEDCDRFESMEAAPQRDCQCGPHIRWMTHLRISQID